MARKNQEYKECVFVWNSSTNLSQTGDAANITLYTMKDGGSTSTTTNSVAEVDATNMPGVYKVTLTASEMNGDSIALAGTSTTANVAVNPSFISTEDIKTDTLQLLTDVGNVDTVVDLIKTDTTQIISDVGGVQTDTTQLLSDVGTVDTVVDSIKIDTSAVVAKLPSGIISDIDLDDIVDGAKLRTIFGLMKARVLNKYNIDNPASGDITFFQDDNVTFLARVNVTQTGRTKTSFVDL